MMWEYARFDDDTRVSYSDTPSDGVVKVVIERPRDWGFDVAACALPSCAWSDVDGFTSEELERLEVFLCNHADRIARLAARRGRA